MQMKRYLEKLLHLCSDELSGQEAVEWAVLNDKLGLTFILDVDLQTIMGDPDVPNSGLYEWIIDAWQQELRKNTESLVESYAVLFDEINCFPSQPQPAVAA